MNILKTKEAAVLITLIVIVLASIYGLSRGTVTKEQIIDSNSNNEPTVVDPDSELLEENEPPEASLDAPVVDEIFELGQSYYNAGDFKNAIEKLKRMSNDSPSAIAAEALLLEASEKYRAEILETTDTYAAKQDYKTAIAIVNEALSTLPEDAELTNTITECKVAARKVAIEKAESYISNNDYEGAILTLQNTIVEVGQNEELTARLNILESSYCDIAIDNAKKQFIQYDVKSLLFAEDIISSALAIVPNSEKLKDELEYYVEQEPIDIMSSTLLWQNSDKFSIKPSATDSYGNEYVNVIYVSDWGGKPGQDQNGKWWYSCIGFIETDFQYSKITGILFQNSEYASAPTQTQLRFSKDGILWEGTVTGDSAPINFEVNISGKKEVMIALSARDEDVNPTEAYNCAYVANLYLWK